MNSLLDQAIQQTQKHLLSLRNAEGHWEGELASSALSSATAVVALILVDAEAHDVTIARGAAWLVKHQNEDGGWGDTTLSKSNLSTTLLCWSALHLIAREQACACPDVQENRSPVIVQPAIARASAWIQKQVGSLEPKDIQKAVIARYGKDKTFSVPILMLCAIGGTLGHNAWRMVLPLPFELAALPRTWFGAIGLPVVSYALPALIAIGYARHAIHPFAWWNPLRWLKAALWSRISPMLKELQPGTGGYLEATPLTSFVTMALAASGQKHHPCVPEAVRFLLASQRADGSWPIDTNLATWGTTLASKALFYHDEDAADTELKKPVLDWLLQQQYKDVHPFTNAAPGAWAWTDLPGGVPDADDTSGALVAMWQLAENETQRLQLLPSAQAAIRWLLDLQNRDGGMPTFCRGWGALPFDRSTPEITAHVLWGFATWHSLLPQSLQDEVLKAQNSAWIYLQRQQRADGSWLPLWFGNEHTSDEENPVHGTAMVLLGAASSAVNHPARVNALHAAASFLLKSQRADGSWGGAASTPASLEETGNAISALCTVIARHLFDEVFHQQITIALGRAVNWLIDATQQGKQFSASPIGLYFARLWYHEKMYPVVWTLQALKNYKQLGTHSRAEQGHAKEAVC